jgi:hypothetical protein
MYVTLTPAYGRDYKSQKAVKADWAAGKDFIIETFGHPHEGKPINKQDADGTTDTYNVRYDQKREAVKVQ